MPGPRFGATANETVLLPVPDVTDAIEIHGAFDVAAHAHPLFVVNVTEPLPPLAATDWLVGRIAYVHVMPA